MSYLVGDVVNAVRNRHAAFNPRQYPDGVAYSLMATEFRKLVAHLLRVNPAMIPQTHFSGLFAVSLVPFPSNGISLSEGVQPIQIFVEDAAGNQEPVELVPFEHRFAGGRHPSAYVIGDGNGALFLRGTAADWLGWTKLSYSYVGIGWSPVGMNEVVPLPDMTRSSMEAALARGWAARYQGMADAPDLDLAWFDSEYEAARNELDQFANTQVDFEVLRRQEVW